MEEYNFFNMEQILGFLGIKHDFENKENKEYPFYDWNSNKGYPTKKHRAAIREHGTTPYHRMTFNLLGTDPQLEIPF